MFTPYKEDTVGDSWVYRLEADAARRYAVVPRLKVQESPSKPRFTYERGKGSGYFRIELHWAVGKPQDRQSVVDKYKPKGEVMECMRENVRKVKVTLVGGDSSASLDYPEQSYQEVLSFPLGQKERKLIDHLLDRKPVSLRVRFEVKDDDRQTRTIEEVIGKDGGVPYEVVQVDS